MKICKLEIKALNYTGLGVFNANSGTCMFDGNAIDSNKFEFLKSKATQLFSSYSNIPFLTFLIMLASPTHFEGVSTNVRIIMHVV